MAKIYASEPEAKESGKLEDKVFIAFLAGNQDKIVLDNGDVVPKFRASIRASDEVRVQSKAEAAKYFGKLKPAQQEEIREVLRPVIEKSREKRQERNQILRAAKSGMFMFRK